jgi:hypothetical protein
LLDGEWLGLNSHDRTDDFCPMLKNILQLPTLRRQGMVKRLQYVFKVGKRHGAKLI